LRGDELHPYGQRCAYRLRRQRFDMNWPVVAETHHFGDAAGVVSVGFDRPGRQEALSVTHLDTYDGDTGFAQPAMQPF
jgi:hypothetical protein